MPIRGLDALKSLRPIIRRTPAVVLKDSALCVDGHWFMKKYLYPVSMDEYFINGLDLGKLHTFVDFCRTNNVDVCWVWNGLARKVRRSRKDAEIVAEDCRQDAKNKENKNNRNSKKEANSEANSEAKSRRSEMARAITALRCEDPYRLGVIEYENGNRPMANKIWRLAFDPEDHVLEISEILQSNGVTVVRAPYAASAQCVHFHNKGFCNYVFGPTDLFLFDIEKIITEFIFLGGESQIELTSKIEIMKAVKLPNNRFIDLCLMLGCEYCPTIPPYANNFNVQNVIEAAKIINDSRVSVKQFMLNFYEIFKEKGQSRGGYSENRHDPSATHRGSNNNKSINTHTNDNSNIDLSNSVDINPDELKKRTLVVDEYMELFSTARAFIKHHPVMTENGLELLSGENVSGLDKVFGNRLPSVFYEKLFLCKISPDFLCPLVYGEVDLCFGADENVLRYQIESYNLLRDVGFSPDKYIDDSYYFSGDFLGCGPGRKVNKNNSNPSSSYKNDSKANSPKTNNSDANSSKVNNSNPGKFCRIEVSSVDKKAPPVPIRKVDFYAEILKNFNISTVRQILCMLKPQAAVKAFDARMIPFLRDLKLWHRLVLHRFQVNQLLGRCVIVENPDVPVIGCAMNLKKENGCIKLEISQREKNFLKIFKGVGNSAVDEAIAQIKNLSM